MCTRCTHVPNTVCTDPLIVRIRCIAIEHVDNEQILLRKITTQYTICVPASEAFFYGAFLNQDTSGIDHVYHASILVHI